MRISQLEISALDSGLVEKLSGDNSKREKERVMDLFKSGYVEILFELIIAYYLEYVFIKF